MKKFSKQAGNRKSRFARSAVLASLAMAAATVGSSQAFAAVICASTPINLPATINGIYINFVTGASSTSAVAGWDFNTWATGGNLAFFGSNAAANTTAYVGAATQVSLLAGGTMIDASSTTVTGVANAAAFLVGVTNGYVGVVFRNEGTAVTNYGWASLTTTAGTGFPATLNEYCYQNDGTGIMAGTTPVSLQSYSVD